LPSLYHALGLLELDHGNSTAARIHFRKGIDIAKASRSLDDDSLPYLMHSLGLLELNENRFEDARGIFTLASSIFPNQSRILLGLANVELKLGNNNDARNYFEKSVIADPYHAQAW
jgi:tetratricopeptide (TPR) repeat protein